MKSKKKILVFIDWFLPGFKAGGPIQSCANLIEHLKEDADFFVVTRDTDYCETIPYPKIQSNTWVDFSKGIKVYYFSNENLNLKTIRKIIFSANYDVIYLNGIYSFYFSLIPLYLLRKKGNQKIILSVRGMLAESAIAVKKSKKKLFLSFTKSIHLFRNIIFHATSTSEGNDIQKQFGNTAKIEIAPNLPALKETSILTKKIKNKGELRLINVARIAPEKNLFFALEILKEVKSDIIFDFYGPIYDKIYFEKCQRLIAEMPNNIVVSYKNSLEREKISSTLSEYHYLFMPTLGENFGHIIFESLSAGCPVIVSDQTPWKGLSEKNIGWDIDLTQKNIFLKVIEMAASLSNEEYDITSLSAYNYAKRYAENEEIISQNRTLFLNS